MNLDSESLVILGIVTDQIKPVFRFELPLLKGVVFP
jgi:hypothetical protein